MNEISIIGNDFFGGVRQNAACSERQGGGRDLQELQCETSDKLIRSQYASVIELALSMGTSDGVSSVGIAEHFDTDDNMHRAAEALAALGI
jgi:hypothetical protein